MKLNNGKTANEKQAEAMQMVKNFDKNLVYMCITGGPGTGKTTITQTLIRKMRLKHPLFLGPTHKSINQLKKSNPDYKIFKTFASFCNMKPDYEKAPKDSTSIKFTDISIEFDNLLYGFDCVIIDETSMATPGQLEPFLKGIMAYALKRHGLGIPLHIFFLGDLNQLDSPEATEHVGSSFLEIINICKKQNRYIKLEENHRSIPSVKAVSEDVLLYGNIRIGHDYGEGVEFVENIDYQEVHDQGNAVILSYSNRESNVHEENMIALGYPISEYEICSAVKIFDRDKYEDVYVLNNGDRAVVNAVSKELVPVPWCKGSYETKRFGFDNDHEIDLTGLNSCRHYEMKDRNSLFRAKFWEPTFNMVKQISRDHDKYKKDGRTPEEWMANMTPNQKIIFERIKGIIKRNRKGLYSNTFETTIMKKGGYKVINPYKKLVWGNLWFGWQPYRISIPQVSTVHKSQGDEWNTVYVCIKGMQGLDAIRLLYVAVSRARKRLVIVTGKTHHM